MGVAIIAAVQSLSQLQVRYGEEGKEIIIANASTHIILPGCSLPECTYYAERAGMTTQIVKTKSASMSGISLSSITTTTTPAVTPRQLMTPDEIRRMPERQ